MKNSHIIRRIAATVLAVVLFAGCFPVCFADGGDDIMDRFAGGVQRPRRTSILETPVQMTVKSQYGNLIYVVTAPRKNSTILGNAYEAQEVTVYAIQDGYALAIVNESNLGGWMKKDLLDEEYYTGPNPSDTLNLESGVRRPTKNEYISSYETKYVKSKHGICIYLLYKPNKESDRMGYIYEAEKVTVLARCGGYSFVRTEYGRLGWCSSSLLTSDY